MSKGIKLVGAGASSAIAVLALFKGGCLVSSFVRARLLDVMINLAQNSLANSLANSLDNKIKPHYSELGNYAMVLLRNSFV